MDDRDILSQMTALVEEEEHLRRTHVDEPLADADRARVEHIEVALDQCWDLLRQRRARREHGQDPDSSVVRDTETVERYTQ